MPCPLLLPDEIPVDWESYGECLPLVILENELDSVFFSGSIVNVLESTFAPPLALDNSNLKNLIEFLRKTLIVGIVMAGVIIATLAISDWVDGMVPRDCAEGLVSRQPINALTSPARRLCCQTARHGTRPGAQAGGVDGYCRGIGASRLVGLVT